MMDNYADYMKRFPQICFQRRWTVDPDTIYKLGQCDAIVQSLVYLPLAPSVRAEMLRVSLVKGAAATTAIEGNTLSEEDIRLIEEGAAQMPASRHYQEREVKNVLDAFNGILNEVVEAGRIERVTPQMICGFNAQVGDGLGESFQGEPGRYRAHEVVVGAYRPPDHRYVGEAVQRLCDWLALEFAPKLDERQPLFNSVVEAIVSHVYLVWIHPFGDGNGRTARLVEFYLLLRGGLPNICTHILSNHYNETRGEYYRQLATAGKTGDLTAFIKYAVDGFLDGLKEVLAKAQGDQIRNCWRNYVYDRLDACPIRRNVRKRFATLLTEMNVAKAYTVGELREFSVRVATAYAKVGERQLAADLNRLVKYGLLLKDGNAYAVQAQELFSSFARKRSFVRE
jgi:Fic family protein